jgi:hypothetical protein
VKAQFDRKFDRRIVRVTYSKAMDRVRIVFDDRTIYVIPRQLLEGLEKAAARELATTEILEEGPAISWPLLGVTHKVPGLLNGTYGGSRWMASLKSIPRAIPGQPMFGSRRKKAEMSRQYYDDRYVVTSNPGVGELLPKRRSAKLSGPKNLPQQAAVSRHAQVTPKMP